MRSRQAATAGVSVGRGRKGSFAGLRGWRTGVSTVGPCAATAVIDGRSPKPPGKTAHCAAEARVLDASEEIHADTQGQSLPAFGLATLLGVELLPRIRNWKDLIFYRPTTSTRDRHIDALFGDNEVGDNEVIAWKLIETHGIDRMRVVISLREGRSSSSALLRRLTNESRKNRIGKAFRELGRAIRTIVLLRYRSVPELRESSTTITNRVESFHTCSKWRSFGNAGIIADNDPEHMEQVVTGNELLANGGICSNAAELTAVLNQRCVEGNRRRSEDVAALCPLTLPTTSCASATTSWISPRPGPLCTPTSTSAPTPARSSCRPKSEHAGQTRPVAPPPVTDLSGGFPAYSGHTRACAPSAPCCIRSHRCSAWRTHDRLQRVLRTEALLDPLSPLGHAIRRQFLNGKGGNRPLVAALPSTRWGKHAHVASIVFAAHLGHMPLSHRGYCASRPVDACCREPPPAGLPPCRWRTRGTGKHREEGGIFRRRCHGHPTDRDARGGRPIRASRAGPPDASLHGRW